MNSRDSYSLIVVGTGFASSFFLQRYLERTGAGERVLVLERGPRTEHREQLKMSIPEFFAESARTFVNRTPEKPWVFRVLFGGSSNCWVGQVPRMLPEDSELASTSTASTTSRAAPSSPDTATCSSAENAAGTAPRRS